MFDIIGSKLTPSLARQLIRYSQYKRLDIPNEVYEMAKTDLIETSYEGANRDLLQALSDNKFRGIVIDSGTYGLELVAAHLVADPIVVIPAAKSRAQKQLASIAWRGLKVVNSNEYVSDTNDTILYLANHWSTVENGWTFYNANRCIVFIQTQLPLDGTSLDNICALLNNLQGNEYHRPYIKRIIEEAPKERMLELLGLFGVFSSHNCVNI